jgi:two-component system phosphate regulon sensor histidine kinase PhoR
VIVRIGTEETAGQDADEVRKAFVTVEDTGIGIPDAEQERVFERFYRVDKSHSRQMGGTGLGLSIVKHGARFHDASIDMESAPGSGTKITIRFLQAE